MGGFLGGLNAASEAWGLWVVHAGWQAAAVGLAILLVERLGRRWPSPLRYGLLVLALVKFAVPATVGAPVGLFGWIGPAVSAPVGVAEADNSASGSVDAVESHDPVDAALPFASGPAVPRDVPGPVPGTVDHSAARIPSMPATLPRATAAIRPVPSWKAWLMLFYLAGTAGVAAWIAGQWVRLLRTSRCSEQVTSGVLYERFVAVCRDMGLRRSVWLLLTDAGEYPYSFGLLRPAVAIPRGLAERLSEEDLRATLAHEAGHHRRGDLWINAVQMAICMLWWFHPIAWLVNRALRRVREECCDDLLLGKKMVDAESYCGTLLQVAAEKTRRMPPRLALSMADGLHPLGGRFMRIMDSTLRRPTATPRLATLAMVVLAVLLLPGLRNTASTREPENASTDRTTQNDASHDVPADTATPQPAARPFDDLPLRYAEAAVKVAQAELEAAQAANRKAPGSVPPGELRRLAGELRSRQLDVARLKAERKELQGESRDDIKVFRGRGVDELDKPVPGAHVWYPVKWTAEKGMLTVDAACDAEGRFALSVPAAWLGKPTPVSIAWEVWAFAEGRSIGTASVSKQIFAPEEAEELKIVLGPPSDTSFVVLDPDGKPVAGAVLEPQNFRTQIGYSLVPEPMLPRICATTDAQGWAAMPAVSGERLYRVVVRSEEFGEQAQIFRNPEKTPANRTIDLRPAGRIEGRVIADDPALAHGLRMALTTETSAVYPWPPVLPATEGYAMVESDRDGRFTVPALAEGTLRIDTVVEKSDLPFRPRLPDQLEVQAGQTTEVEIRFVPAVPVEGVVRVRGTGEPVEGAEVSVRYGIGRQGDTAFSDAEGKFTAYVLPGEVRLQMIYIPGGLMRIGSSQPPYAATCTVPEDAKKFTLPPLEVVRTKKISGRLVDPDGKPVAHAQLSIEWDSAHDYAGKSDDKGQFVLRVPAEAPLDALQFNAFFVTTEPHEAEVVQRDPLVLRIRPPTKVEGHIVDVQGRPVSDAVVTIRDSRGEVQTTTWPDGRFSMPAVFFGSQLRFVVKAAGYEDSEGVLDLEKGDETAGDFKIVLRRAPDEKP
jgi:beta-lactamase regulating signal transducer with metallopeptidase domain